MKTRKEKLVRAILLIIGILLLPFMRSHAEDLRSVARLSGFWKFSIGDNMEWANPNYDDSKWDEIHAPDTWESEGYDGYNGYAWYRRTFNMSHIPSNTQMFLIIGNIDDCDEIYINGTLVGKSGIFPPAYETAYGVERKYPIPAHILKTNGENHIAIRIYDSFGDGGIVSDRVGIYIDEDVEYLNLDLTGLWKFKLGNNTDWKAPRLEDANWDEVSVPASWESQGYEGYDGYAWYRKSFTIPSSLADKELYLSLGKIDDYDRVFLNGQEIGEVYDLKKDSEYRRRGYEYNARRVYPIPEELIKSGGTNTIAIRVYDEGQRGGIYEGPIGIMDEENFRDYRRKHEDDRSFWDYIIDKFSY